MPSTPPIQIPQHLSKPVGTPGPRLLEIERSKASFAPAELQHYLYGNEYIERVKKILPVLESEVSFLVPATFSTQPARSRADWSLLEPRCDAFSPRSARPNTTTWTEGRNTATD